jgi:hypothetical protein
MNEEQQRIAIAEACGWKWERLWTGELHGKPVGEQGPFREVPDYLTDLNAMHEAEKVLTEEQRVAYSNHTYDIVCEAQRETKKWRWILLTAAQRAEAFLRTIGKWTTPTQTEQTKL